MRFEEVLDWIESEDYPYNVYDYYYPKADKPNKIIDKNIVNSGSVEKIVNYLLENSKNLSDYACHFLINRVRSLNYFEKLEQENAGKKHTASELITLDNGDRVLGGVEPDKWQTTDNGCWSCAYSLLLKSRKVNVTQEVIRAYHGNEVKGEKRGAFDAINSDKPLNPTEKADILMKLVPNTAMKELKITISGDKTVYRPSPDDNPEEGELYGDEVMRADVRKETATLIKNHLRECITKDKSPVAFLVGKHFVTVVGVANDGQFLAYNSSDNKKVLRKIDIDTYIDIPIDNTTGNISMVSLMDINVNKENASLTQLPEGLKTAKVNADGSIEMNFGNGVIAEDEYGSKAYCSMEDVARPNVSYSKDIYIPRQLDTKVELIAEKKPDYSKYDVVDETYIGEQDIVEDKASDLYALYKRMEPYGISKEEDEAFYNISASISRPVIKKDAQSTIAMKCVNYLLDNKLLATRQFDRDKIDLVMTALGILDYPLAKEVAQVINSDRKVVKYMNLTNSKLGKLDQLKPVDVDSCLLKLKRMGIVTEENALIYSKADEDTRIANLKQIYEKLTSIRIDSIFHVNSSKFDALKASMQRVFEYGKLIDKGVGKHEILNKYLLGVEKTVDNYLRDKHGNLRAASTPLGKYRQELALAALSTVNRQKAKDTIGKIAELKKSDFTYEKVVADTQIDTRYSAGEKRNIIAERMENIKKAALSSKATPEDLGAYIIYKSLHTELGLLDEEASNSVDISADNLQADINKYITTKEFTDLYADMVMTENAGLQSVDCDKFFTRFMGALANKYSAEKTEADKQQVQAKANPEAVKEEAKIIK